MKHKQFDIDKILTECLTNLNDVIVIMEKNGGDTKTESVYYLIELITNKLSFLQEHSEPKIKINKDLYGVLDRLLVAFASFDDKLWKRVNNNKMTEEDFKRMSKALKVVEKLDFYLKT
jgi:hypothetical protein